MRNIILKNLKTNLVENKHVYGVQDASLKEGNVGMLGILFEVLKPIHKFPIYPPKNEFKAKTHVRMGEKCHV